MTDYQKTSRWVRTTAFWAALSILAAMTAAFIAWTGVAVGTALGLWAVFALLVIRPPQNMMER
ncbi:MAG: hypothetical protein JNM81_09325, partial [Rhodospirillaceae bacterium]|nr:hypothetical protein [Rhodospirillaceae bacterium]